MMKMSKNKESMIIGIVITLIICGTIGFTIITNKSFSYDVKTFSSYDELFSFLEVNYQKYTNYLKIPFLSQEILYHILMLSKILKM